MTVLNTWIPRGPDDGHAAYVQCDYCLPPRQARGTPEDPAFCDWRFEDFEAGPHRCPWCASLRGEEQMRLWRPQAKPALPNLIIIGAAKAGTSALHHYLGMHPEIFMSEVKELKFFQDPDSLAKLDTYMSCFDGSAPVRGEATPIYTCHPLLPGVPERIKEAVPEAKLIYLVRDPVERAIAMYAEAVAQRIEARSIERVFRHPDDPYNDYVAQSRYATQYETYARVFPEKQILVIDQADLLGQRGATLARVFGFLGVDPAFASAGFERMVNVRESRRQRTKLGRALRTSPLARATRRLPPAAREALFRPARRLTSERLELESPSPDLLNRLWAELWTELERLRALTGVSVDAEGSRLGRK